MPRTLWLLCLLLGACGDATQPFDAKKALLDPSLATLTAPDRFRVKFETTKGDFVVEATRAWAPHGVDRFYNLVRMDFFTDNAFFRVIRKPGLSMVQFGVSGKPAVNKAWAQAFVRADLSRQSNRRGYVTFGQISGPATRNVQLFINYGPNPHLDHTFAPIGKVIQGMEVVDSFWETGEGSPQGPGPSQGRLMDDGNKYLQENFPKIDYIRRAALVE